MKFLHQVASAGRSAYHVVARSLTESYRRAPASTQKGARRLLFASIAVSIAMSVWNLGSQHFERRAKEDELRKGPRVRTAVAVASPADRLLRLTGEARPFASVTLFAKIGGYLKAVKVDKGDVVIAGQSLAVIESPETDKAYQAALSDYRNKQGIARREQTLFDRSLVSVQERDQVLSDAEISLAHLESQGVLKSYEIMRAPFAGTITARFADPGALLQNASGSLPVLAISQVDRLRVYVYLDQKDASFADTTTAVEVSLAEKPGLVVPGHVARLSGELDEKTRMLLTEIDLDNGKNQIVAGSLVQVTLHVHAAPGVEVPAEALVLRDGKTMVPIVDSKNEVTYFEVNVVEGDGQKIKVRSGLASGQVVALNLGNALADHSAVRPLEDAPPLASAGGKK